MVVLKFQIPTAVQTITQGTLPEKIPLRLPRFPRWLLPRRKETFPVSECEDHVLGKERIAEGGYYQISEAQADFERNLELNWVDLMTTIKR